MSLFSKIPTGRASATSVPELAEETGLSEREVRAEIARLVNDEHRPIVCLPTRRGIYRAATPEDLDLVIRDLRSRAGSLLRRSRALRLAREEMSWSPTLFNLDEGRAS